MRQLNEQSHTKRFKYCVNQTELCRPKNIDYKRIWILVNLQNKCGSLLLGLNTREVDNQKHLPEGEGREEKPLPRTPSIATIFFKAWPISLCFCKVISHPLLVSSWKAHLWNCRENSTIKGNCVLKEQLNSITTRSRPTRTLNKWLYKQEPPHATTVQLSASE